MALKDDSIRVMHKEMRDKIPNRVAIRMCRPISGEWVSNDSRRETNPSFLSQFSHSKTLARMESTIGASFSIWRWNDVKARSLG